MHRTSLIHIGDRRAGILIYAIVIKLDNIPVPVINIGRIRPLLYDPSWIALTPFCHSLRVSFTLR